MRTTRRWMQWLGIGGLLVGNGCSGGGTLQVVPILPTVERVSEGGVDRSPNRSPTAGAPVVPHAMDWAHWGGARSRVMVRTWEMPSDRPGLGTRWGETRVSPIATMAFERAEPSVPFATAALYYDDEAGVRAVGWGAFQRMDAGLFPVANGLVAIGVHDETGHLFPGVGAEGRWYLVGEAGHRYVIVVRNQANVRLEVVLSVDGLDVLDGRPAAFYKRGYLVDPRGEIEIEGFRQSLDTVAAFRFGSVLGSYAGQKNGDTRNVGLIGVAVFHEVGTNPLPWTLADVHQRRDANPFPGQFAAPP